MLGIGFLPDNTMFFPINSRLNHSLTHGRILTNIFFSHDVPNSITTHSSISRTKIKQIVQCVL